MQNITLHYNDRATGGSSDKEYRVQIEKESDGYVVNFQFGRRGGTLQAGTKTGAPITLEEAERVFERLVNEKMRNGYQLAGESGPAPLPVPKAVGMDGRTSYPVELLEEISRETAELLVKESRYWMQVKIDGHRRQIEKTAKGIVSYNRKGEAVGLPSEVVNELNDLPFKTFMIDGELVGNAFVAFDLLKANGMELAPLAYSERFDRLQKAIPRKGTFLTCVATWKTTKEKQTGLAACLENRCEGVVFKLQTAPYRAGRNGQHKKFKFIKSCTCKVIALGAKGHESATLALFDGKGWREVGRASMIGKDKRIKVGSLVEVEFLYFTGARLYQPRIKCLREDVRAEDCTMKQLAKAYKEGVAA